MSPSTSRGTMKAQFPDWQKQQDAAVERGLISPAWHQKFKWATTELFHISHGQMHHPAGCFVYGGIWGSVSVLECFMQGGEKIDEWKHNAGEK